MKPFLSSYWWCCQALVPDMIVFLITNCRSDSDNIVLVPLSNLNTEADERVDILRYSVMEVKLHLLVV